MSVEIRPLREEDAYTSVKWRNDPEVFRFTEGRYDHEITIDDELAWIRNVMTRPNELRFAILVDGVYIGNCYLLNIRGTEANSQIFIGDKRYWGRRAVLTAYRRLFDYAFYTLGLLTLTGLVRPENVRSLRMAEFCGFKQVGCEDNLLVMQLTKANYEAAM